MSIKNIVLIGAGGNLGPPILEALTKEFNVTVLSRASSKSKFSSSVHVVKVSDDYPHIDLVSVLKGQDAVVSTIAGFTTGLQKGLIDASIEAGVKRFIPAEWGSDSTNPDTIKKMPIFKGKNDIVEYLKSKESPEFSWTAIATGAFFEWGLQDGFLHFHIDTKKALILDDGNVTWPATTFATIGLATTRALQRGEQTRNKYLYIQSFRISQNQIVSALEKATGAKWETEAVSLKGYWDEKERRFNKDGDHGAMYDMVYAYGLSGYEWESRPNFGNGIVGLEGSRMVWRGRQGEQWMGIRLSLRGILSSEGSWRELEQV